MGKIAEIVGEFGRGEKECKLAEAEIKKAVLKEIPELRSLSGEWENGYNSAVSETKKNMEAL